MPEQLSKEEILKEIERAFDEIKPESMKDMGKVMKSAKEKIGAQSDGKTINEVVKKLLA